MCCMNSTKAKINVFWKKKNYTSHAPFGTDPFDFFFKNIDFSLWGKRCSFLKRYHKPPVLCFNLCTMQKVDIINQKGISKKIHLKLPLFFFVKNEFISFYLECSIRVGSFAKLQIVFFNLKPKVNDFSWSLARRKINHKCTFV